MTQVDFYILTEKSDSRREDFACKMTEKIFKLGRHAYIHTNSRQDAQKMDARLWSYRPGSFIPHSILVEKQTNDDPVTIGYGHFYSEKCNEKNNPPVLINLADAIPEFFNHFERITEIIDKKATTATSKARERYQYYRDQGCVLNSHELSN